MRPTKESLERTPVSIHLWKDKKPEAQFGLREKVVLPQADQMKEDHGWKEPKNMVMGDDLVETGSKRFEAIIEEDFIGSDDDEVKDKGLYSNVVSELSPSILAVI